MTNWRLAFLGTAASAVSKARNPTGMLLTVDGKHMLIECGEGTTRRLIEQDTDIRDIVAVYISHGHNDHFSGIVTFLWENVLVARRTAPLRIIAPGYVIDGIKRMIDLAGTPAGFFEFELVFEPVDEQQIGRPLEIPGFPASSRVIRSHARAVHDPPARAIRIDVSNVLGAGVLSACYSSDTSPSSDVANLAKGCDYLIHEATVLDEDEAHATRVNHSTPSGAGRMATIAGAAHLVIVHYSVFLEGKEPAIAAQARKTFTGNVIVAKDGMLLPLEKE
ncbi:MAG: MBL fold metallo-hydrolase [Candidatus Lokiarchaeota archaeon]|nr:MBL fold metallo-hydrolase [Candidatus Lokiarchaeota archaeon]